MVCGSGSAPRAHLRRVYLPLVQLNTVSGAELDEAEAVRTFAHSEDEIQHALADVTISLDAADWFDIKEPIHNVIRVDMPPKTR